MPRGKKATENSQTKKKRKEENIEEEPEIKQQKISSETTVHHSQKSSILEKGHIYFFYRPKVELTEVHSFEDVQRLYLVLVPLHEGSRDTTTKRILVITRKMLPETDEKSRKEHKNKFWAFVEKASTNIDDIDSALDAEEYHTKTRGDRVVAAARPIAEGYYAIVKHEQGHTHLAYVLELPKELGEVQKAFHIHEEGSFIISVKNPKREAKGFFRGLAKKAVFPDHLQKLFEDHSWSPVITTEFLNYESAEILIIGASSDIVKEFGKVGEKIEAEEKEDLKHISKDSLFEELHMSKKVHPPLPFTSSKWK